jgi:hypothetical protein
MTNAHYILVAKPDGKRPLGRPTRRRKKKLNVKSIFCGKILRVRERTELTCCIK